MLSAGVNRWPMARVQSTVPVWVCCMAKAGGLGALSDT